MSNSHDRELGMDRAITRRDFLNGMTLAVTGSIVGSSWITALGAPDFAPEADPNYYPPSLTGMRGSHPGSFEAAHKIRDGFPVDTAAATDTGEAYDLIIVGGGISGLAAAYFYRKSVGEEARILVLDNHDDFGGHAKRNEFRHGDRLLIGYGGTQSIDRPSTYSPEAAGLLREIGIDVKRFYKAFDRNLYESLDLSYGVFFDKETFGTDRLVPGLGSDPSAKNFAKAPIARKARKDIVRLYEGKTDYLPELSVEEKKTRLKKISYRDFLLDVVKAHPDVARYFQSLTLSFWCTGIDAVPAYECLSTGWYPGLKGMGVETTGVREEPYIFHFPDGGASIARLLVRSLIPDAVPGQTMEDVVTARVDYSKLDRGTRPVKVRLNSLVVRARHDGDPGKAKEVIVTYLRGGKPYRVRGKACVLACYNSMVPFLCPEIPEPQKKALLYGVKSPLVYTNVLIRNWTSFKKLGIHRVYAPAGYHSSFSLDFPVSLGSYRFPSSPEEPMVVHMVRVPASPGRPAREQFKAGRWDLLSTTFETFERKIRDQLGRALSGGGFEPARDIEAITVNRWPHGYAYEQNSLYDPDWAAEERPCVKARQPFGRISIANSDADWSAYTNPAIDQAHRAVREIVG